MRTGKTRTVIEIAHKNFDYDALKGVLVLAPNGVHSNWVRRELPRWSNRYVGCAWNSNLSREGDLRFANSLRRLDGDYPDAVKWLAVNSEALINPRAQAAINAFRKSTDGQILLVADECSDFRRPGSKRTQLARGLAKLLPWKRILDGTAIHNSPLHAFSQFELLRPGALGFTTYRDFKERYAVYVKKRDWKTNRDYTMLDHYINMEELRERMAEWSSVVLRRDCDDMPELIRDDRPVEMSEKQVKAYREMVKTLTLENEQGLITAKNGGAKVIKLHQIVSGFIIDNRGDVVSIDDQPPLLDAMWAEVEGYLPGKSIVWCRFQEDIRRVCRRLAQEGVEYVEYHGEVSTKTRELAIERFMTDPACKAFVGQPQAGGRGLNLSAADLILWYSCVPNALITEQANERGTMMGGRPVSIVVLATGGTVHDDIVSHNEGNIDLADTVAGSGLQELLRRTNV